MKNIDKKITKGIKHLIDTEYRLIHQLWIISLSSVIVSIIFLIFVLPNILTPFYENNLYSYLKGPLDFIGPELSNNTISTDVAFIIAKDNKWVAVSRNVNEIISSKDYNDIIAKVKAPYGKFTFNGHTYYYSSSQLGDGLKIAITNDKYIRLMKNEFTGFVLPSIIVTISVITALLLLWNSIIVKKVEIINEKMENIDNKKEENYVRFKINDELSELLEKVKDTKQKLMANEEYKTQILQNISHELKTPITVIKSYIEGVNDRVISQDEAMRIISEETNKLKRLVESLLYINKLDYMKETQEFINKKTDINKIITNIMNKYKKMKRHIEFTLTSEKEQNLFTGSDEMWEMVIENLFNNFVRYAEKKISVVVKKNKLRFYNDGKPIDKKLLKNILKPYEKGNDGQFGLGLTIVFKTITMFGYNIKINNLDKGVEFIIE